jgi:hypothetical protein
MIGVVEHGINNTCNNNLYHDSDLNKNDEFGGGKIRNKE